MLYVKLQQGVDFTSQNHGYAVSREDLPEHLIITHEEINDKSVEGVRHRYLPGFSVQFHPDAALVHMMQATHLMSSSR